MFILTNSVLRKRLENGLTLIHDIPRPSTIFHHPTYLHAKFCLSISRGLKVFLAAVFYPDKEKVIDNSRPDQSLTTILLGSRDTNLPRSGNSLGLGPVTRQLFRSRAGDCNGQFWQLPVHTLQTGLDAPGCI